MSVNVWKTKQGNATVSEAVARGGGELAAVAKQARQGEEVARKNRHSLMASKATQMATVREAVAPWEKLQTAKQPFTVV